MKLNKKCREFITPLSIIQAIEIKKKKASNLVQKHSRSIKKSLQMKSREEINYK